MGCIHDFYDLPTIQLVAGSTEPLVFYCWHEITKDRFDVSGCTANFSVEDYVNEEYVNDVKPSILTKPMIVDAANNAISVTLESLDTINMVPGEYIYQITLKDALSGMVEIPHQGIIYIANNINKDFLLNGKYPTLFDTSDATAKASDILYPKTAYGPDGKITGSIQPVPQAVPQITVDGGGLVTATSTQTSGIIASGTKSSTYQIPSKNASDITVNESTVTIPAGYYPTQTIKTVPSSGSDTSDATASASDILYGKTAYVNGRKITGVINGVPGRSIVPTKSGTTAIQAGKYAMGDIIVSGDSSLVGSNIRKGVSIFGVNGTYEAASDGNTSWGEFNYTNHQKISDTITFDKTEDFNSAVLVNTDTRWAMQNTPESTSFVQYWFFNLKPNFHAWAQYYNPKKGSEGSVLTGQLITVSDSKITITTPASMTIGEYVKFVGTYRFYYIKQA